MKHTKSPPKEEAGLPTDLLKYFPNLTVVAAYGLCGSAPAK